MTVTIRLATIDDRERVARLAAEVSGMHARAMPERFRGVADPWPPDYLRFLIESSEHHVIVAERGGDVVGYVTLQIREAPAYPVLSPRRFVVIDEIVVASADHGQGIGRRLVDAAEVWARGQGATALELNVYEFNEAAIGFYEHLGFTTFKRAMELPLDARSTCDDG